MLFLLYINDIPPHNTCSIKMYPDDTAQSVILLMLWHHNMIDLHNWSINCYMHSNKTKCKIMHSERNTKAIYYISTEAGKASLSTWENKCYLKLTFKLI